jgi:hypothetical protein
MAKLKKSPRFSEHNSIDRRGLINSKQGKVQENKINILR